MMHKGKLIRQQTNPGQNKRTNRKHKPKCLEKAFYRSLLKISYDLQANHLSENHLGKIAMAKVQNVASAMMKKLVDSLGFGEMFIGKKNLWNNFLRFGSSLVPVIIGLKSIGWEKEKIGKFYYAFFIETLKLRKQKNGKERKSFVISLFTLFFKGWSLGKSTRKQLELSSGKKSKYEFSWESVYREGDHFLEEEDFTITFTKCGLLTLFRKYHIEDILPFVCLSDYLTYKKCGIKFERKNCLAMGDHCCTFSFYGSGTGDIEDLVPKKLQFPPTEFPDFNKYMTNQRKKRDKRFLLAHLLTENSVLNNDIDAISKQIKEVEMQIDKMKN